MRRALVLRMLLVVMAVGPLFDVAAGDPCELDPQDNFIVDQKNDDCDVDFFSNIRMNGPIGQEFTPTFDHLDAVELYVGDWLLMHDDPASSFQVIVHAATITGTVVGRSNVLVLPDDYAAPARFVFSSPGWLTVGAVYVIEIVQLSGPDSYLASDSFLRNPYPGGSWICSGRVVDNADTWFRVGILAPTAVHETTWGQIKSLFRTP